MVEDSQVLSVNSNACVLRVSTTKLSVLDAVQTADEFLKANNVLFPQLLHSELLTEGTDLFFSGPEEVMTQIKMLSKTDFSVTELASVSATCRGTARPGLVMKVASALEKNRIKVSGLFVGAMNITVFIEKGFRNLAVQSIHALASQRMDLLKTV